jgi:hypothetical protein
MNQLPALQSADFGMGERITEALKSLDNSDDSNDVLKSGKGRKLSEWVHRIPEGEDIKSMAAKLSQASKKRALPAILYSRSRGLNSLSPDAAVNVKDDISFKAALNAAKVDITWLELSYSVTTIATSREETEAMMLMWFFHVSRKKDGNHKIKMSYEIDGAELPLEGFIVDPTALFASDISLPEEHLFGLKQDFTVQVPCLYGKTVDIPKVMRVGFDFKVVR